MSYNCDYNVKCRKKQIKHFITLVQSWILRPLYYIIVSFTPDARRWFWKVNGRSAYFIIYHRRFKPSLFSRLIVLTASSRFTM